MKLESLDIRERVRKILQFGFREQSEYKKEFLEARKK